MRSVSFTSALHYAWHGSGRRWDALPLQAVGSGIGGFLFWYLGLKVPQAISNNPALSTLASIIIGGVAGVVFVFLLRLCWWPYYWRLEPHGGLATFLHTRLGTAMWPAVLTISGFLAFVLLCGVGVIWLSLQVLSGTSTPRISGTPNTIGSPDFVLLPPEGRYKFKWDPVTNPRIDIRLDTNRNPDFNNNPAFIVRNKTNTVAYNIAAIWKSETATSLEELIKLPSFSKFKFNMDSTGTKFTLFAPEGSFAIPFSYYLEDSPTQIVPVIAKEAEVYFPLQLLPVTALYLITKMPPKLGDTSDPFILRVSLNWETSDGKRQQDYRLRLSATNAKATDTDMPIAEGFLNFNLEEIKR
jgi:hypothetical protein